MSDAKKTKAADARPVTRIVLVLRLGGTVPDTERLSRLVSQTDVASILLVPTPGASPDHEQLRAVISVLQHNGTAVLIADDTALASDVSSDGVHLSPVGPGDDIVKRYEATRKALGPNAIIGVDAGTSRHDAMALGEAGADYVAFNETDAANSGREDADEDPAIAPLDDKRELIAWWAEIFEPPVVAFCENGLDEACEFASLGADFVGLELPAGLSPADEIEWLQKANDALAAANT